MHMMHTGMKTWPQGGIAASALVGAGKVTYLGVVANIPMESRMTHYEIEYKARELRAQALRDGITALRKWIAARLSAAPTGRTA